jgi:hypothetical protein
MQANTAVVANQPVNFPNFSVENESCHSDPFAIRDGRFVGHDGFVVPKDFGEFHERFPQYVRKWVNRHAGASAEKEDWEDRTQDLLIQLQHLPSTSKHRVAGKEDVIQTFDPAKHYGANQARFQNYINLCLTNKFRTLHSKRMKDALSQNGKLSLDTQREWDDPLSVDDEFCHAHSEYLREVANASEKQARDRAFVQDFVNFVRREDARLLPAMDAILATDTLGDAAKLLGITEWRFAGTCTRLRELGKCFLTGEPTPRKRRTYKKRKRLNLAAIPKKTETPPTPSADSSLCINLCTEFEDFQQFLPLPLPSNSISLEVSTLGG